MRVALYGGSFNPPHLGHAQVVLHLLHAGFDEVWVIPAAAHPFGKELAPFGHRMRMLQLAMADFGARVRLCDVEMHLPAPSWTVHTVEHLLRQHPEHAFSLVLGEDQNPDSWHRIDDLRRMVPFFFVRRGTWRAGDPVPAIPDYSSSEIRRRLSAGQMPDGWLHASVCAYIRQERLYGLDVAERKKLDFAIVGLGKVGGSLLFSLHAAGHLPRWCADPDSGRWSLARPFSVPTGTDWRELWHQYPVKCLVFCTPDPWRPYAESSDWSGGPPLCLHTGGMHAPSDVFEKMGLQEDVLGILHPVLAVASPTTDLRGRLFSVTGNTQNPAFLHLLQALSAQILPVAAPHRPLFHALCALLSNGAQVLELETAAALGKLSMSDATVNLWTRQLVEGGLAVFLEHREAGLTGPWARRDAGTIRRHLDAIAQSSPDLMPLYRVLQERVERRWAQNQKIEKIAGPEAGSENRDFS